MESSSCLRAKSAAAALLSFLLPLRLVAQLPATDRSNQPATPPDLTVTFDRVLIVPGAVEVLRRSDGMLWVVSASGLFRYDGYDLRHFHDPWDAPEGRFASYHSCAAEDENGTLWVGARHSFKRFDDQARDFEYWVSDSSLSTSISHNTVLSVCPDGKDHVWVGTLRGLNKFDCAGRTFQRFYHKDGDPHSLLCDTVEHLRIGTDGTIWTGSSSGLCAYDPVIGRFASYTNASPPPFRLPRKEVKALLISGDGSLWIATAGGISVFDFARGAARLYPASPARATELRDTVVTDLCEDNLGNIWIGTGSNGLVRLERATNQFTYYLDATAGAAMSQGAYRRYFPVDQMRSVRCISVDRPFGTQRPEEADVLWVYSDGAVWRVAVSRRNFAHLKLKNPAAATGRRFETAYVTRDKNLWTTFAPGRIARIDLQTLYLRTYATPKHKPGRLTLTGAAATGDGATWLVLSGTLYRFDPAKNLFGPATGTGPVGPILAGRDGSLWIGTAKPENMLPLLARLRPGDGNLVRYERDLLPGEATAGAGIISMLEDRNGDIWFGTFGRGLYRLDPETGRYRHYSCARGSPGTLKTNVVRALLMDSSGVIWLGTDSGLHRYHPEADGFERFATTGMEANDQGHFIRGMAFDGRQDLWLAHSQGISRFDRARLRFRDFTEVDGLKQVQYVRVFYEPASRTMYAQDIDGSFISFRPDELPTSVSSVKVTLTDFRVFENPVSLPEPVYRVKNVALSHDQNFFSFRFSALEFLRIHKVNYAYKMEGFDRDWVQAGSRAYAGYTNLDHGSYIFKVKATDADGVWSDSVTSISIIVHPPWYETPWAYGLFAFGILCFLYGSWRYDRRRVHLRHQLEMKVFEASRLQEIDLMKSRFFANISHECRTPLTLILGPVEKLMTRFNDRSARKDLETIKRNATSLLSLISQLLDLSRLDAGRMVLQVSAVALAPFLTRLVASFAFLAEREGITLLFDPHERELTGFVDLEKLEKIVLNLLSNALKFTDAGGEIVVTLRRTPGIIAGGNGNVGEGIEIVVSDTGKGIPEDKLGRIFDRFYRVDSSSSQARSGTGIGLSLTKELVQLHHGSIRVASGVGKGTTFLVWLPIARESYDLLEIVHGVGTEDTGMNLEPPTVESVPEGAEEGDVAPPTAPLVLVVEDNAEMRQHIREYLTQEYRVIEAANGKEGLERGLSSMPDLVITDLMMPRMDGLDLCRTLKGDQRTSHIPVVLLTARATEESKMEALETGADDYLLKPFDAKELLVRARNLIEIRRALREKFRENIVLEPAGVAVSSTDAKFLKKLMESIERHMAEPDCDTETLAKEVCMSRMQLNRKLQALTGHSTHEFLRVQRLRRAAELLRRHSGNVSEVAYEVGFSSPSHFSVSFREQFGMSPSDYEERNRIDNGQK